MPDTKSMLRSRTVWANIIGLLALLLGAFGVDTGGVDQPALAEAAAELVAAASLIASTVFRLVAKTRLLG